MARVGAEMSAEVLEFTGITSLDIDPMRILEAAKEAGMTEVVIIGLDADGVEYLASSQGASKEVMWHLERAKWRLMQHVDRMVEGEE